MTEGNALYVNPSSLAVPLIALGAKATIAGPNGEREIDLENLYQVPKTESELEHTLAAGEIVTKVTIPSAKGKNASYEVRQKQAHDWPLVLASVNLQLDGSGPDASSMSITDARVVIYGVAPIPWRSSPAEEAIKGKRISLQTAEAAGDAAIQAAKPLSMNAFKVSLTKTAVKRALLAAVGNRYWEF
jgi:xanthine dehydrogenase YagS FAD-binding subunit